MEIQSYQKNIAKLEIQNNIHRQDIHNSQFERINLLKRTNEIKNKIDEINWEGQKYQIEKKSNIVHKHRSDSSTTTRDIHARLRSQVPEESLR